MQSEKTCKMQSFTSMGNPGLGPKRLESLQNEIAKNGLDGFLIPRSDTNRGEYASEKYQR